MIPEAEDGAVPVTPVVMGAVDEVAVEVVEAEAAVEAVEAEAAAVAEVVEAVEAVEAEAAVEAVAVEGMTTMTTTMTRAAPHPRPSRVFPDVYDNEIDDEYDDELIGSSTTPRCNNNWPKSYKINVKRRRVDALRVSRPPTPSPRPTKTDDAPP